MSQLDSYPLRAIAYLDVLGFKDRVWRSASPVSEVGLGASTIDAFAKQIEVTHEKSGLRARAFSDCIVISGEPSNLRGVLSRAHMLYCWLIESCGLLSRGAVTIGGLYESGSVILGPGMVEVYEMERTLASAPRIVLSTRCNPSRIRSPRVVQENRMWFIDPLDPGGSVSKGWPERLRACGEKGCAEFPEGSSQWLKFNWIVQHCASSLKK